MTVRSVTASPPALLALEDGSVYHGQGIGAVGRVVGELVFNTAASGYQEILTDPSYRQQLVVFTQPHIGNTGTNPEDEESAHVQVAGLAVHALCTEPSNWRSQESLDHYLQRQGVPGIAAVDTRALTSKLREQGALRGCLCSGTDDTAEAAIQAARDWSGLAGRDLASVSSTRAAYDWINGMAGPGADGAAAPAAADYRVYVYDFGVKRSILRLLVQLGCRLTVVPADTPAADILAAPGIEGILLSNGPGDPAACTGIINEVRKLCDSGLPVLGVCLGYQLLALAMGARTVKMKFGHHGANHPVQDIASRRVFITSQNHGFAVAESSLNAELCMTHRSLFDGSLQGIQHTRLPVFGFQGHPEASPGPHDVRELFTRRFMVPMQARRTVG